MEFMMINNFIQYAFIGCFILSICIFIFVFIMFLSPKSRAKMMSKQLKTMKHMVDYSKEDLEDLMTDLGGISANAQNNIVTENEDVLRNAVNKTVDINKDAIEKTVGAIRNGWSDNKSSSVYCKYCREKIDADSIFCKTCGKQQ